MSNLTNVDAFSFLQWSALESSYYDKLFYNLGFCKIGELESNRDVVWKSNDIYFFVTVRRNDFEFRHGPGVCGIGLNFGNADMAYKHAVSNGMQADNDWGNVQNVMGPSVGHGIDGVKLYFTDFTVRKELEKSVKRYDNTKEIVTGINKIDHITHNCHQGNVDVWAENYKNWFGMYQNKYFDIDGKETGLTSRAMMSSISSMAIPLNEDKSNDGQIAKFIHNFNGEGVQHIALETNDIYFTVERLRSQGIQFLNTPDTYYDMISERINEHNEDVNALRELGILIDGSKEEGILLQIFTKESVGPVFFEIIQRKGNTGFGHGNFQALFEAIEREQLKDRR